MIGNDIVDLKQAKAESNWKRKRYLEKIFTIAEQKEISNSKNPEITVWLFWSMKEAVYKIINRATTTRLFNPWKFSSNIKDVQENKVQGEVHYNNCAYKTASVITDEYIYTKAAIDNLETIVSRIEVNSINDLVSDFFENNRFKTIKDTYKIPYLLDTRTNDTFPISISHHGKFISMAKMSH